MNKPMNLECFTKPSLITDKEVSSIFVSAFTCTSVSSFYTAFVSLNSNPAVSIIPIIISSYGGEVYALLAMLDIIESTSKPVATIAVGKAMSCGSVLLAAGTRGYRYIGSNTDVMIHEVSSHIGGKTTDVAAGAKNTARINEILIKKLAYYCKKDLNFFTKAFKKRTNTDWYLDAAECKKLGLVDHIGVPALSAIYK